MTCFFAAVRLSARPAPWHALPNERASEVLAPAMTNEAVPMLPGMKTGWPAAAYADGSSGCPGPKARVAPFRWTHKDSPACSSSFAMLCATS